MSTYFKKFATQRKMDNSPATPAYNVWGPANVETIYQGLRNVAAIEEQKNAQWCHTLAGDGQNITSTYKICGWIKSHAVHSLGMYFVFRSAAAWSGDVLIKLTGTDQELTLTPTIGAGGRHYAYLRTEYATPGPDHGGRVQIRSATSGLYLVHLGVYENEADDGPDLNPDQIRRARGDLFSGLANRINGACNKQVHVGGWVTPAGYAIVANSKPADPQIRLYHGLQYVDSKDLTNYDQTYEFHGYVGTMPDLGQLGYAIESAQSSDSYTDFFVLNNAMGQIDGGSWATAAPRSNLYTYLWRTNASAKINLCCQGWWARTKHYAGRPDHVGDLAHFAAGRPILEADFVALWQAAHYGHLYGAARVFCCWTPPGGAVLSLGTGYTDYLWACVPVNSWTEPWGPSWSSGKVPMRFWFDAINGSTSARTVTIKITWGGVSDEQTWALAGSGSGRQYKEISTALAPPSPASPVIVSLKVDSAQAVTFGSIWGAISYPLDY